MADELKVTPGLIVDEFDRQIVNLRTLGSFPAVIASLIEVSQATIKKRIVILQEQRNARFEKQTPWGGMARAAGHD